VKYSKEDIKNRAKSFIEFSESGDPRCELLLMMLSISFGMSQEDCINKIKVLAKE